MTTKAEQLGQSIVVAVREFVQKALSQRDARLDVQEERLRSLETRSRNFRYLGVWTAGHQYEAGNLVTDRGSLWYCNCDTNIRPGQTNAWTLAVKRGANGRDTPQ